VTPGYPDTGKKLFRPSSLSRGASMTDLPQTEPIVAVDLGGTKILAVVVTGQANIIARCKKRTKANKGLETVLDRVGRTVRAAVEEAHLRMEDVGAIGVGLPGPVDSKTGVIYSAPNLGWGRVEVASILSGQLGRLVFVGNDVNLCTLGELDLGAGRGINTMIGVFVGTGIGAGIVIGGELYEGMTGAAGEIGHVIIKYDGPKANTGWRGTMESLAARPAIIRKIIERIRDGRQSSLTKLAGAKLEQLDPEAASAEVRSMMLATAYSEGDKVVRQAVDESAYLVGIAIAGAVHLLNPQMVVVGGGVTEAIGQSYVDGVAEAIRANTFPVAHENLQIVRAALGDDAGVLGAACLVRRRLASAQAVTESCRTCGPMHI
jgi:glucokinase